jgi:hypothetical protein
MDGRACTIWWNVPKEEAETRLKYEEQPIELLHMKILKKEIKPFNHTCDWKTFQNLFAEECQYGIADCGNFGNNTHLEEDTVACRPVARQRPRNKQLDNIINEC